MRNVHPVENMRIIQKIKYSELRNRDSRLSQL